MKKNIAIRFEDVWKSYPSYYHITGGIKSFLFHLPTALKELNRRRTALEGISLEICKGESFGFVGRNGAGKSTALGLMAGVLSPDRGSVASSGRISPLLQLGAGFHPEMTGRENILLNGVLLGLTRAEVLEHAEEIIEFSELLDFIDQPVRTYSSGMYAKLGFSVIAHLKPEILLVDEILSVGDIAFNRKCEAKFEEFRTNPDVTIVLVSHGLESIATICDRAAWIENKEVRMIDSAKNVVREYTAANAPKIVVPDDLTPMPSRVWANTPVIDCTEGPARCDLHASFDGDDAFIRISLLTWGDVRPVQEWESGPQAIAFEVKDGLWRAYAWSSDGAKEEHFLSQKAKQQGEWNEKEPMLLCLSGHKASKRLTPDVWLAVFTTKEAQKVWEQHRASVLARYGTLPQGVAPLWHEGKTLRVVARNIVTRDAVGNFSIGVAGMATQSGLPARLYSYVTCPELAGIVSPIGDLEGDIKPSDTVFYNYSIEDEFLYGIAQLKCCKILYYHNITPGHWFREYNASFADVLDRSRKQFRYFDAFDVALANSQFSLREIKPYLQKDAPSAAIPPCIDPGRLQRLEPKHVPLPEAKKILLWVGRMAPHKQPEKALQMFQKMAEKEPETILVMVGGGRLDFPAYAAKIEDAINAVPETLRNNIHFLSGIADAELAYLYSRANMLLCTSGHEGFCLPVMEAKLFGLEVLALPQEAVEETLTKFGDPSSGQSVALDILNYL